MATQKERDEKLVELMKKWQKVEDNAIESTTEIIKKADNPLVQMVMEIIRQDSGNHRKVQQLIADHFEKETLKLNPDELLEFWDLVEEHDRIERKTIELAKEALTQTNSPLVAYLLNYLLTDEEKHKELLDEMARIKGGMYPYGS